MGQSLRILHCLRAPVGGLFRHVRDLTMEQARLGYEVGVLCDSTTGGDDGEKLLDQLRPHCELGIARVPMSRQLGPRDYTAYLATKRFAEAARANILHGHGAKGGAFARLAARALKKKGQPVHTFYTPHGGSLHYSANSLAGRIFLYLEGRLAPLTDGIIFESRYSARVYEQKLGRPPCELRVIHNGLRPEEFFEPQLDDNAPEFLFVGELRQLKGIFTLIEALAALNRNPPVRAIIVGAGPDADACKDLVHELGIESQVTFPGPRPAAEAFSLGRCLIVPSLAESFPYIVLEAAAAQMPLITTQVGGIPEILLDSGTQMIAPGDAEALRARMQDFLDDPVPFIENAKALKQRVREKFNVETMADAVIDFYFDKAAH